MKTLGTCNFKFNIRIHIDLSTYSYEICKRTNTYSIIYKNKQQIYVSGAVDISEINIEAVGANERKRFCRFDKSDGLV